MIRFVGFRFTRPNLHNFGFLIFMNSPMWGEMIKKYGAEKAEALLKQCKANLG